MKRYVDRNRRHGGVQHSAPEAKWLAYPHDDDDEHDADENQDAPLEPLLAVLRAETHLAQIPHEVAMS